MPPEVDVDMYDSDIQYIGTNASQRRGVPTRRTKNNIRAREPSPDDIIVLDQSDNENNQMSVDASSSRHMVRRNDNLQFLHWQPKGTNVGTSLTTSSRANVAANDAQLSGRGGHKRKKSQRVHLVEDGDYKAQRQPTVRVNAKTPVSPHAIVQKRMLSEPSDDEENYANVYSALDDNFYNWQPFRDTDPAALFAEPAPPVPVPIRATQRTDVSCPNLQLHRKMARRFEYTTTSPCFNQRQFVWNALRKSFPILADHSGSSVGLRPTREKLQKDLRLHNLRLSTRFRRAAGAIHKVVQSSGIIAFCGACLGGQLDEPNEEVDIYNGPGSLMVWYAGQEQIIHEHSSFHKYYTVNDVILDSSRDPTFMVSSGYDCRVRIWSCHPDESATSLSVRLEETISYKHVPFELAFKPGDPILSVACRDGKIYVYFQLRPFEARARGELLVVPGKAQHAVGAMTWGLGETSNHLFASSEPYNDEDRDGFHRAFDVSVTTVLYNFDAREAGDAMSLDCHGDKLAISTHGESHIMRLYDVRRRMGEAVWETNLEPFPPMPNSEVNVIKFSPDTIYLAVARSDDAVHVYDSRMIGRGVLHTFKHAGARGNPPRTGTYGVVQMQWLESPSGRLGLVTGGTDGCIRLWDVCKASDSSANGIVLAKTDSDVGHFSLGDIYKGEKAMVVGDCDGTAYIYDNADVGL